MQKSGKLKYTIFHLLKWKFIKCYFIWCGQMSEETGFLYIGTRNANALSSGVAHDGYDNYSEKEGLPEILE